MLYFALPSCTITYLISAMAASRAAYAAHLQGTIVPSLNSAREAIALVDTDIEE
jgi:hypothetical protein